MRTRMLLFLPGSLMAAVSAAVADPASSVDNGRAIYRTGRS